VTVHGGLGNEHIHNEFWPGEQSLSDCLGSFHQEKARFHATLLLRKLCHGTNSG
jgi:hypothetical protein